MPGPSETDNDISFRVLHALEHNPDLSQRALSAKTQVSLGAVNYCLRALQAQGLIKAQNFRASDNKLRYAYVLTPNGLAAKAVLARRFLARKLVEYAELQAEIETLRRELAPDDPS